MIRRLLRQPVPLSPLLILEFVLTDPSSIKFSTIVLQGLNKVSCKLNKVYKRVRHTTTRTAISYVRN